MATDWQIVAIVKERLARRREDLSARKSGKRLVALLSAFAPPQEIVEAAGCDAVRLLEGGSSDDESRGLRYLKNEACSLLKGVFGALAGDGLRPDAVVVGGACDQLRRSAEIFHRDFGIPVYELAVPRVHDLPQSAARMRAELEWLGHELAAFAGQSSPKPEDISRRIVAWNSARHCCRELAQARSEGRIGAGASSLVARSIWVLGAEGFSDLWATVKAGLPAAGKADEMIRLLLASPPALEGDDLLCNVLDRAGAGVVVADFCESMSFPHMRDVPLDAGKWHYSSGTQEIRKVIKPRVGRDSVEPVSGKEDGDPMESLAAAANSFPLGCGFKRPDAGFMQALRETAAGEGADGAIFRGLSFCAPWNHQHTRMAELAGVPAMTIEGDYSEGQESRVRTRVEAFLESLAMKRTGNSRP